MQDLRKYLEEGKVPADMLDILFNGKVNWDSIRKTVESAQYTIDARMYLTDVIQKLGIEEIRIADALARKIINWFIYGGKTLGESK